MHCTVARSDDYDRTFSNDKETRERKAHQGRSDRCFIETVTVIFTKELEAVSLALKCLKIEQRGNLPKEVGRLMMMMLVSSWSP